MTLKLSRAKCRGFVGRAPLLAALLALPGSAAAQGPVWTFEITEIIDRGEYHHTIRLVPAPAGIHFPRTCTEFVIHARFVPQTGVESYLRQAFNPLAHVKAVQMLREAMLTNRLARIGSYKRGFARIEDRPECEVASNGLAIFSESDGVAVVFSIF